MLYPDVQPVYPQSMQRLHPSAKIRLFLHTGHKVSSSASSITLCVGLCTSSSLVADNALLIDFGYFGAILYIKYFF